MNDQPRNGYPHAQTEIPQFPERTTAEHTLRKAAGTQMPLHIEKKEWEKLTNSFYWTARQVCTMQDVKWISFRTLAETSKPSQKLTRWTIPEKKVDQTSGTPCLPVNWHQTHCIAIWNSCPDVTEHVVPISSHFDVKNAEEYDSDETGIASLFKKMNNKFHMFFRIRSYFLDRSSTSLLMLKDQIWSVHPSSYSNG